MKQSSIEWLVNEIQSLLDSGFQFHPENEYEIINQAKELFKQQIIDGIVQYQIKHHKILSEQGILNTHNKAEQYYNETFKTESNGTT